jgi:hypothetical protein
VTKEAATEAMYQAIANAEPAGDAVLRHDIDP